MRQSTKLFFVIPARICGAADRRTDGWMDSPHIPLTGSPWFRPPWTEVGHSAGDKSLFVPPSAGDLGRCRAPQSRSISGGIFIDAHLGADEASSVILFTSQMLPVNPAATHTRMHAPLPPQTA